MMGWTDKMDIVFKALADAHRRRLLDLPFQPPGRINLVA
jgi:hypothetical protein